MKGKTIAIAAGAGALCILLMVSYSGRDELGWWWRMRGVLKIEVSDIILGKYTIADVNAIRRATEVTRQFIRSLDSGEHLFFPVGYASAVFIFNSEGSTVPTNYLSLDDMDTEIGKIRYQGKKLICRTSAWYMYLGDVLGPVLPDILAQWRAARTAEIGRRLELAEVLLLLAPETEGVQEFLQSAIEGKVTDWERAIWFMGLVGAPAKVMAPILKFVAENDTDEDARAVARDSLEKVLRQ